MAPTKLPVATEWFEFSRVNDWMGLVTESHVHPFLRCNIWHLRGSGSDVVDSGLGVHSLRSGVPQLFEREPALFLTHSHLDHFGGAHEFKTSYAHIAEQVYIPASGALRRDRLKRYSTSTVWGGDARSDGGCGAHRRVRARRIRSSCAADLCGRRRR